MRDRAFRRAAEEKRKAKAKRRLGERRVNLGDFSEGRIIGRMATSHEACQSRDKSLNRRPDPDDYGKDWEAEW